MNRFITSLGALALIASAQARIVTYPAGEGVTTLGTYTVDVRQDGGAWQPVAVYPVKVDEVRFTKHHVETASMAYFDFDGEVDVRVIRNGDKAPESARIRPLSYNITPRLSGDTLTFTLDTPRNLSVEFDGDIFHNLHLFANPLDAHRPSAKEIKKAGRKGSRLVYFGPGVHELPDGLLRVKSGQTVYIDGGARVYGMLLADSVSDVRFYGRGEVHPKGRGEGIYIQRSRNIDINGPIVTQVPVGASDSVSITNVKSISYYGWGDGMNVFASSNVRYDSVFCRNSDDCHTVYATRKGFNGSCRNITMKNSTLWADVAHPIFIGLHGSAAELGPDAPADTITGLHYSNIDILDHQERQIDYQGVFGLVCGDNNIVDGVVFDGIRVENFRLGRLFDIRIAVNKKYCKAPGGAVRNILFKDIVYNGDRSEVSLIQGYNDERKVENVTFDNLVINGKRIYDDMPDKPKWYKTADMARIFVGEFVDNIVFK